MSWADVTKDDHAVFSMVADTLLYLKLEPGEYRFLDDFASYSPGVKFLMKQLFREFEKIDKSLKFYVICNGLVLVGNPKPPSLWRRIRNIYECYTGRTGEAAWY